MTTFPLGYKVNFTPLDQQQSSQAAPNPPRTEDIVAVTGDERSTEEAKSSVNSTAGDAIYNTFIKGYGTNMSAEELRAAATNLGIKQTEFNNNPDFYTEQALTVTNDNWEAVDTRIATNYQIAQEIIASRKQEIGENKGVFGRGVDAVDRFLRDVSPIGTYEGITTATANSSMEILTKASTMSPTEFRSWFNTYADEVAKEGIFRSNTMGAFSDLEAEVSGMGFDPNKDLNQLLGVIDIATSGIATAAVKGVKSGIKASIKSSTAVGRVAAIEGPEAGAKAAESIIKVVPDPEALANVGPRSLDLNPQPVSSIMSPFVRKFQENKIIQAIEDIRVKGGFGRVATSDVIKKQAKDIADKITKNVSNPVFDFKLTEEVLGSYTSTVRFGKPANGAPFKPLANGQPSESLKRFVEEVRTKVERADIVPVDPNDVSKGYVVEVSERINLSGLPGAIDETLGIEPTLVRNTIGKVMNNPIMGSAALRDNQRIATLADMAESSRAAVKSVVQPYIEKISNLSAKERYTIQAVYTELRDGADAASRVRYTEAEFYDKYKKMHPNGAEPSKKAFEAYEALAQVEEADYLLKSHNMLNRYVEKGYQNTIKVYDNYKAPAKKVNLSSVPADAKILDAKTGAKLRPEDFVDENLPIWKLDKPTKDGQEYVVDPLEVRLIDPTDVMGYNPGGSRLNPQANYFVVIGGKRIKALLSTFSEKQAKLAKEQLTNIKKALEGQAVSVSSVEKGSIQILPGTSDWASALQFQKIGASEPPLAPNHFRLYRGEGGTLMGSAQGGRWFTLDLAKAENYAANGGKVVYLDIDIANRSDLLKLTQGHGGVDELLIDDAALRATAKPLVFKTSSKNTTDLDEIIQANNDWNPGIQTAEEFRKFADEEGWDFTRGEITYKNRDGDLLEQDVDGSDLFSGMKLTDYVENDMRRNDKVLLDFGGGRAYNTDPVNSILAQFGNSVFTYSNRAYARNAMVGWVKKAQQKGRNWFQPGISSNDYEALFRTAKVTGNDEFSRRMREMRNITLRRMGYQDEYANHMETFGQQLSEFVFDKTGLKLTADNPINGMLKIGFQSAFGFMNVSQFFMQAFHATTVIAISPVYGLKGAALTVPLRSALRGSALGYTDEVVKRWAKAAEISEKEASEWLEFIRTSGRAVVDGDAIEDGTGVGFGISGWRGESMKYTALSGAAYNVSKLIGKGLDAGLMPFKAGERLARMTAMNTAILEYKAKFPNVSIMTDTARHWITRREQDLTFNMSSSARSAFQTGPAGLLKVPTQWLAYTMRAMESVVVGRNFTVAERARLFTALGPMFGLAGFGGENAADYIAEKLGLEPGGGLYTTLKYGMIDGLLSELPGGVDIGVGKRLAPVGAIFDTWKNITEGKFLEVAGGPSGQIAGGLYTAAANTLSSLLNGQSATLTEDVIQLLRVPSGLDNIAKAYGIFNNGIYRSKTGVALEYEMSVGDGIVALTGFTPLEVVENYSRMDALYTSEKKLAAFRKEVNRDAERIFALMQDGDANDIETALALTRELDARIIFSGFSQSQISSLKNATRNRLESSWSKIQSNLIEQEKLYALQAANAILKGDE